MLFRESVIRAKRSRVTRCIFHYTLHTKLSYNLCRAISKQTIAEGENLCVGLHARLRETGFFTSPTRTLDLEESVLDGQEAPEGKCKKGCIGPECRSYDCFEDFSKPSTVSLPSAKDSNS